MTGYSTSTGHSFKRPSKTHNCLQRGLSHYIEAKDAILWYDTRPVKTDAFPNMNMEAWVSCCEETMQRIQEKYYE